MSVMTALREELNAWLDDNFEYSSDEDREYNLDEIYRTIKEKLDDIDNKFGDAVDDVRETHFLHDFPKLENIMIEELKERLS